MKQEYKEGIEKECKKQAEIFVDNLYDNLLFNPKLTRKDLRVVEQLIVLHTRSTIVSHITGQEFLDKIEGIEL